LSIRILLTGYADVNAAVDAINRGGAFRYLHKPWVDEDLVQTVTGALQQYWLIKENKRLNSLVKKQNEELKKWNSELEQIVQEQTIELKLRYEEERRFSKRLRKNFKKSIKAFSGLMELRDKRIRSHSRNVAEIAGNVAKRLELSQEERDTLVVAALLHDIGKIGIPDVMLHVEEYRMNNEEREEYIKHPVRGQAALDNIEELRDAGLAIRHHHESYDGSGFPDGIKGNNIPLAARIVAIIDAYDKELRKFEGSAGIEVVSKHVKRKAETAFDPTLTPLVVEECRKYYKQHLPVSDRIEMELDPKELHEGMVLSRDVFSGTGILLLGKDTVLNITNIEILKRYYKLDPSSHGVFVSMKNG
jgi:putative nucleotidyltransferase with HDIG domain